jgi:hypothetical protein
MSVLGNNPNVACYMDLHVYSGLAPMTPSAACAPPKMKTNPALASKRNLPACESDDLSDRQIERSYKWSSG